MFILSIFLTLTVFASDDPYVIAQKACDPLAQELVEKKLAAIQYRGKLESSIIGRNGIPVLNASGAEINYKFFTYELDSDGFETNQIWTLKAQFVDQKCTAEEPVMISSWLCNLKGASQVKCLERL